MSEYLHGAYGVVNANGIRETALANSAIVVIGTAPGNGPTKPAPLNKPVVVRNMAEAQATFGYDDDWEQFTLCEAMHVFFDLKGVGPLVLINVAQVAYEGDQRAPLAVDPDAVIGTTDNLGSNTGLYVLDDVYTATGMIPGYVIVPGYGGFKQVHDALIQRTKKIAGHWDAFVYSDLPLVDDEEGAITLANAAANKKSLGFTAANEKVFFPMALGTDGKKYHLSVLAAANFQELLKDNDAVPYMSSSNTDAGIIQNLWMGADNTDRLYNDQIINDKLCKNGIASACYMAGKWVLWGAHAAEYVYPDGDSVNVSETNRMMLYYISNDFQHRRMADVDKPMTANDIASIVAEEQARLDALVKIGALTYGKVILNATRDARSDVMNGDFSFAFSVTTTPLAKSLTAIVTWTPDGFATYFEQF